jgi:hypothetical protein
MDKVLLRLSDEERLNLQLLNAALRVSEYTDDVDDMRTIRREDRMIPSMKEFFSAVVGLTLAASEVPKAIKSELENGKPNLTTVSPILSTAFEVARRHKRLNPHHNRSEYGKLVMILQDANAALRLKTLGIPSLVDPVVTVKLALEKLGASDMMDDPLLAVATAPLLVGVTAEQASKKQAAMKTLLLKYAGPVDDDEGAATAAVTGAADSVTPIMSPTGPVATPTTAQMESQKRKQKRRSDLLERCILSVADAKVFLHSCVSPIDTLLSWLETYFISPNRPKNAPSIKISRGRGGSCLSHDHETQGTYAKESLVLWKIIQRDIFDFWQCVEDDMVVDCNGSYRFCDTGQGFHRLLSAPKTYARMSAALAEAHRYMGGWVGIKVVHLGDRDVPNALVFIDKYTIIPKMLTPIVQTIERIDDIFDETKPEQHPGVRDLLKSKYNSGEELKLMILADFFKHAFDGSGDDGGNCIDGRLTSAWNWCHLLHKKSYYDAFVLTGFTGFDG